MSGGSAVVDTITTTAVVLALGVSAYQTYQLAKDARVRDAERRVERSLELYRDLVVEGDTAASFNRLSVKLKNLGTDRLGTDTWLLVADADFRRGGALDPAGQEHFFQDLYRVMWYFERVRYSLDRHLLDEDVLFRTVGFHSWWWGQLLIHIRAPKASVALHELACRTEGWAVTNSEIGNWVARCSTDFDGHGPVVLWAPPQPFAPPVG